MRNNDNVVEMMAFAKVFRWCSSRLGLGLRVGTRLGEKADVTILQVANLTSAGDSTTRTHKPHTSSHTQDNKLCFPLLFELRRNSSTQDPGIPNNTDDIGAPRFPCLDFARTPCPARTHHLSSSSTSCRRPWSSLAWILGPALGDFPWPIVPGFSLSSSESALPSPMRLPAIFTFGPASKHASKDSGSSVEGSIRRALSTGCYGRESSIARPFIPLHAQPWTVVGQGLVF